ncbi:MAG: sel1 repeat family protein, partial [Nitrospira sp.]|nr:sel1 repeat family protein [Nitrospira sp.]
MDFADHISCRYLAKLSFALLFFEIVVGCATPAEHHKERALQGDADSQYVFGEMNLRGSFGVPRDEESARFWLEKVSSQGHEKSQLLLGKFFVDTAKKDDAKKWLEMAADKGNREAQFLLGDLYSQDWFGLDYVKACRYLYLSGRNELVGENGQFSRKYKIHANEAQAQYKLGLLYINNKCNPAPATDASIDHHEEALKWFMQSADSVTEARPYIIDHYYSRWKQRIPNDFRSIKYFTQQAESGSGKAKFLLAVLNFRGCSSTQRKPSLNTLLENFLGGNDPLECGLSR